MLDDPVLLEGGAVEKSQGADGLVKAAPGHPLLVNQIQLVIADLFRPKQFRRFVEVTGEQ